MTNAAPGDRSATGMAAAIRVLKILGLMGLGGVLTLAGLFLSGAGLVWRTDFVTPPLPAVETDSDGESEPWDFELRSGGRMMYNARYVAQVEPADPDAHAAARGMLAAGGIPEAADTIALVGHRVAKGDGAVISYQHGWGLREPDQYPPEAGFEKFTLYLAAPLAGTSGSVALGDESGAFAFWSAGPANPPWDGACIAYATEGRVDYRHKGEQMELNLALEMQPVRAGTGQSEGCEPVRIRQRVSAWISKADYLDAWSGAGWGRVTIHEAVRARSF